MEEICMVKKPFLGIIFVLLTLPLSLLEAQVSDK